MPGGDVQDVASRKQVSRRGQCSGIVVERFREMPSQTGLRLGGIPVPMDGYHGSGLDCVQHPPGKIFRAVPKDRVHPEARRRLRPGGQFIVDVFGNRHGFVDILLIR